METVTFTVNGIARQAEWNGKKFLVAPMTLLVSGVLNGSKGSLYYPAEEVHATAPDWEGVAITHGHPISINGEHISAHEPGVKDRSGLGVVRFPKAKDGRLTSEAWFDIDAVNRIDSRILNALQSGQKLELSTGLYTENHNAPPGSHHDGRAYQYVAKSYKPDHLAILMDQTGACAIADGCGVFNQLTVNPFVSEEQRRACYAKDDPNWDCKEFDEAGKDKKPTENARMSLLERFMSWFTANAAPGQPRHGDSGQYLPHGSGTGKGETHAAAVAGFTDTESDDNEEEEDSELEPTGNADEEKKTMPAATEETKPTPPDPHAASKQAALASVHAEDGKPRGLAMKAADASRKGDSAAASEHHGMAAEAHEAMATKMRGSGDQMGAEAHDNAAAMHRRAASIHTASPLSSEEEGQGEEEKDMTENRSQLLAKLTANCTCDKDKQALNALSDDMIKHLATPKVEKTEVRTTPTVNAEDPSLSWVKTMFPGMTVNEVQEAVANSVARDRYDRAQLVNRLTANVEGDARERLARVYQSMKTDELRLAVQALPQTANSWQVNDEPVPNYLGQGAPLGNSRTDDGEDTESFLRIPALNYAEMAKEGSHRKQA